MFLELLNSTWIPYSKTWKKQVTPQGALIFQLQVSVRNIKEKEFGLLPTVTQDSVTMRKRKYRQGGLPLTMAVKMFPTPKTCDTEGGIAQNVKLHKGHFYRLNKKGVRWGVKLRDAANHLYKIYPTLRKSDYKDCGDKGTKSQISMSKRKNLCATVKEDQLKPHGKLNPNFCEVLMLYPINWTKIE
jgi:hypothetical protein